MTDDRALDRIEQLRAAGSDARRAQIERNVLRGANPACALSAKAQGDPSETAERAEATEQESPALRREVT